MKEKKTVVLTKNQIVTVTITDLSSEGLGIGHVEGMVLFVKDTVIGDEIEARITKVTKSIAFGRVEKILVPSADRTTPRCADAARCGGCQIQMMSYQAQLRFKENRVRSCIERIGGFENPPMQSIIGMDEPWNYRNKAQYPIGTDKEGNLIAGFYAGRTHSIIDRRNCDIGDPRNAVILQIVLDWMKKHHVNAYNEETCKGIIRHVMIRNGRKTGQIMVCIIATVKTLRGEKELAASLMAVEGIASVVLNINAQHTNVILGKETRVLAGQAYIEDLIGDVRFHISAQSFFQVNPVQTEKLYGKALEYAGLQGNEMVWDLYCGIGTISLFLAQKAGKVCGVEIVPEAIEDARRNARLNGMDNVSFFVGKAEEVLPQQYKKTGERADVIVVDPPRKGCDETLLHTMLDMAPERIVYVSCDPATLARDLKILCEGGYQLRKVQPVDQFCHTVHVETVVLMSKMNTTK